MSEGRWRRKHTNAGLAAPKGVLESVCIITNGGLLLAVGSLLRVKRIFIGCSGGGDGRGKGLNHPTIPEPKKAKKMVRT